MKIDEIVFWCVSNNLAIKSGYTDDDFITDRKTIAITRLGSQIASRKVPDIEMTPEVVEVALNECVEEFKSKYETKE